MFCSSCGTELTRQTKYCKHCGAQLIAKKAADEGKSIEDRLYDELVGIFWVTVIGLGLILGGMVVMKRTHLSDALIIAYLILSSTAFTINFALSLWQIRRLAKLAKEAKSSTQVEIFDTNELSPGSERPALEPAPSVTETTTRKLEPAKEQVPR